MKFSIIVALAAAVSVVVAHPETNGERLARGLPPLPPARRATPVQFAKRTHPSGVHNGCKSGNVQCCNSYQTYDKPTASGLSGLLGITIPPHIPVGLSCSPISLIGLGRNSCQSQTVCCENNHYNGLVVIGCSPININL